MSCLEPPCDSPAAAAWRTEVGTFRAANPRRIFPMRLHIGAPAEARVSCEVPWPEPATYDVGLRFDVLDALLDQQPDLAVGHSAAGGRSDGCSWLSRPGVPELHDVDLAWFSAARRAFAAHGCRLACFRAVTRTGWVDVVTGERRSWARLRL